MKTIYECGKCHEGFDTKGDLLIHLKLHDSKTTEHLQQREFKVTEYYDGEKYYPLYSKIEILSDRRPTTIKPDECCECTCIGLQKGEHSFACPKMAHILFS